MVVSPLRYPGGKAKLFPFFAKLIETNRLFSTEYCEPYAGGAGLAIRLLTNGFVERISINDIDHSIYAFWISALRRTDQFCRLIEKTPVTVREWRRQKKIWVTGNTRDSLGLGFSVYFLNRTSRSGIIEGAGPIGGHDQTGEWKVDARLIKHKQIENLKALSRYSEQIKISNLDALAFFKRATKKGNSFVYLDPPYFVKGRKLYKNFYKPEDHAEIARTLRGKRNAKWVISYDSVPEIQKAYAEFSSVKYSLDYSAGERSVGTEVIFASDSIVLPGAKFFKAAA